MNNMLKYLLFVTLILAFPSTVSAAAEEESDEDAEEVVLEPLQYFKIAPNILTTYQNTGKKMKYIVVQVQVVVRGDDNFALIDLHTPLLQDALTDLFNRQDKKVIEDLSQRESLRLQATERVASVMKEEVGEDIVENVLFTQYVFQ